MDKKYNIVVTGCGGDIGQSIGKILKSQPMFGKVIGCDMSGDNAAKFIFDKCYLVPSCRSENYLEVLQDIINGENIDILLTASEPELRYFTEQKIENTLLDKPLITANLKAMQIGFDKLLTAQFLKENKLPFPETTIASETKSPVFPVIMKDRKGSGSKSLFVIKDREEFDFYCKKYSDYIVQQYLDNENEEYTCGLFRSGNGETRILNYRRKLMGGFSGFGVVVENKAIDKLLLTIAEKINLKGSINVQLRLSDQGPMVFEINPRFSSTVMFRHMMGFEDVIWSIQDRLGLALSKYEAPANGKKFYKGFNEYID